MRAVVAKLRQAIPADRALLLVGLALLFAGYLFAFTTTLDQPFPRALSFAAINTAGASIAGLLFHPLVARFVIGRPPPWPALLHPALAVGFAVAWYFCTLAGFALTPGWMSQGLRVAPFGPVALSWQLFEGMTVYAALALFIHWRRAVADLERQRAIAPEPAAQTADKAVARPESLLIRRDKEVVPVAAGDLIRIAGADGYSEVVTRTRRILSTTPLSRFEAILPADQFVRAHRSHIVRLGSVDHAEPAGNARLLLHLEDGARIMTSRAGAKRLRDLTV